MIMKTKIIQKLVKFNTESIWTSFLVSKKFLNSLGLESNLLINYGDIDCVHTGISIINADKIQNLDPVKENYIILDDKRIAFNLNTKKDYELLSSSWNFSYYSCLWTPRFWYHITTRLACNRCWGMWINNIFFFTFFTINFEKFTIWLWYENMLFFHFATNSNFLILIPSFIDFFLHSGHVKTCVTFFVVFAGFASLGNFCPPYPFFRNACLLSPAAVPLRLPAL